MAQVIPKNDETTSRLMQFDAFISYRRSDGGRFAKRLRKRLIAYRLPEALASGRQQPLRIFLDKMYERASEDFFIRDIVPALENSRHLILVHTPDSLEPHSDGSENWVAREVGVFRSGSRRDLISVTLPSGHYEGPLAADLHVDFPRIQRVDMRPRRSLFSLEADGFLQLVAALHQINPSDMPVLRLEEERRRRVRWAVWLSSALVLAVSFGLISLWLYRALQESRSLQFAAEARSALPRRMDIALSKASAAYDSMDTDHARSALLAAFQTSPHLVGYVPCNEIPRAIALSPDARWMALHLSEFVEFWSLAQFQSAGFRWRLGAKQVQQMEFSGDSRHLFVLNDGRLEAFDLVAREPIPSPTGSTVVTGFSSAGLDGSLWVLDRTNQLQRWSPQSNKSFHLVRLEGLPQEVMGVPFRFSADGARLGFFDQGGNRFCSLPVLPTLGAPVFSQLPGPEIVAWDVLADGAWVGVGYGPVVIGGRSARSVAEDAPVRYNSPLVASADGETYAYADELNRIVVRFAKTPGILRLPGHTHNVYRLAYGSGRATNLIASVGDILPQAPSRPPQVGVVLWDVSRRHPIGMKIADVAAPDPVVALDRSSQRLACSATSGRIDLWRLDGPKEAVALTSMPVAERRVLRMRFGLGGTLLAAAFDTGSISVWDISQNRLLELPGSETVATPTDHGFSPGGDVMRMDANGRFTVWKQTTHGFEVRPSELLDTNTVETISFSDDGRWLAWVSGGLIRVCDVETLRIRSLAVGETSDGVHSLSISPTQGTGCAVFDHGLRLFRLGTLAWDGPSFSPLEYDPSGLLRSLTCARMSSHGRWIASYARQADELILWSTAGRSTLGSLPTGELGPEGFMLGNEGRVMISASRDAGLMVWNLDAEDWSRQAHRAVALLSQRGPP